MGVLLYALDRYDGCSSVFDRYGGSGSVSDRYGGNRGIAHGHGYDLEEQRCCHRREEQRNGVEDLHRCDQCSHG